MHIKLTDEEMKYLEEPYQPMAVVGHSGTSECVYLTLGIKIDSAEFWEIGAEKQMARFGACGVSVDIGSGIVFRSRVSSKEMGPS